MINSETPINVFRTYMKTNLIDNKDDSFTKVINNNEELACKINEREENVIFVYFKDNKRNRKEYKLTFKLCNILIKNVGPKSLINHMIESLNTF